jgi:hypothetical protein
VDVAGICEGDMLGNAEGDGSALEGDVISDFAGFARGECKGDVLGIFEGDAMGIFAGDTLGECNGNVPGKSEGYALGKREGDELGTTVWIHIIINPVSCCQLH